MPVDPTAFWPLGTQLLRLLCRAPSPDLPICKTRVLHGGRGLLWDKLVGIHPREDDVHVFPLEVQPDDLDG